MWRVSDCRMSRLEHLTVAQAGLVTHFIYIHASFDAGLLGR